jgi:DNA-binding CsgD family transcriptional regulator
MEDAYRERFYAFDPARRLPRSSPSRPIFADPALPGQWLDMPTPPATRRRVLDDFVEYRRGFLEPNDLVRHTGFFFNDNLGRTLLFDFHRGRRARAFNRLEVARARVIARYLYARFAATAMRALSARRTSALDDALSARELEVAAAVSAGLSNKAVASALRISVRTVENHLRSIFDKLRVDSRTQLTAMFRHSPHQPATPTIEVETKETQ